MTIQKTSQNDQKSRLSRRSFLATSAAAGAIAVAAPSLALSQAAERAEQFPKWQLWVQLTGGGKPYPATLQEMFLDPMFLEMEVWPIDQPASYAALVPQTSAGPGAAPTAPVRTGRGATGGAPTEREEPKDYPWEPSGGRPHPGYDVMVLNDQWDWPEATRKLAQQAVEAKRGFVLLHHSLGDNQDWPWWYQEVTGGLLVLNDRDGMKKSSITRNAKLDVRPVGNHPILRNVEPFTAVNEEAYQGMWQSPKITPLLQTSTSGSDKVVAWVGPSTQTRVVCIQLGTSRETHRNPNFRMLVRNSILWTAGRLV
ncbi:MAG: ThuA domain-containing protein [Candidatus Korobacteraceae bacterium]